MLTARLAFGLDPVDGSRDRRVGVADVPVVPSVEGPVPLAMAKKYEITCANADSFATIDKTMREVRCPTFLTWKYYTSRTSYLVWLSPYALDARV